MIRTPKSEPITWRLIFATGALIGWNIYAVGCQDTNFIDSVILRFRLLEIVSCIFQRFICVKMEEIPAAPAVAPQENLEDIPGRN